MTFAEWCSQHGMEIASLNAGQLAALRAMWQRTYGDAVTDLLGPYPNEHAARLRDPKGFAKDTFRRTKDGTLYGRIKVAASISVIWGKLKGKAKASDYPVAQSLRFPTSSWTAAKARKWCDDHDVRVIRFEPAKKSARTKSAGEMDLYAGPLQRTEAGDAFAVGDDGEWRYYAPAQLEMLADAELDLAAAAADGDGDGEKLPTFKMVAYTGGLMRVASWFWPVAIDLSGLKVPNRSHPALLQHDRTAIVGHTTEVEISGKRIRVAGVVSGTGEAAREVVGAARNKFPWQVSVGVLVDQVEFVEAGKTASANGTTFKGPCYVARKATLGEFSFVSVGADQKTSARVAASPPDPTPLGAVAAGAHPRRAPMKTFEEWLQAKGFGDADALTEEQRKSMQAWWQAECADAPDNPPTETPADPPADPPTPAAERPGGDVQAAAPAGAEAERQRWIAEGIRAEAERRRKIEATVEGLPESDRLEELKAKALAGDITLDDLRAAALEAVKAERAKVTPTAEAQDQSRKALLAAAYQQIPMPADRIIEICGEQAVDAADRLRGMGLQEFCAAAAALDGVQLGRYQEDKAGWLRAAFSTVSLPGILSNTANKALLQSFMAVESTWRKIAAIRSVKDFKTVTSYRLTGDAEFDEVGPDGEIKHGTVGEQSYTNQAKTYGRMYAITRQTIINDDLGALNVLPARIGRGAALKLNKAFWTEFLDHSSFSRAATATTRAAPPRPSASRP